MPFLADFRLSLFLTALIAGVCLMPVPETSLNDIRWIDKWTHLVLFGGYMLALLWEISLRRHRVGNKKWAALTALTWAILFGGLIEIMQSMLTTYRSGDTLDWLADTAGTSVVYLIIQVAKWLKHAGNNT